MALLSIRTAISVCVLYCTTSMGQDFTWKKGHTQTGQKGTYGSQGVANSLNIPGARSGSTYWQDASGDFWMYGGEGRDHIGNTGILSDLWMYDVSSNNWTWVKGTDFIAQFGIYGTKGTAATANRPGGRIGAVSWVDANGKFWMYGGYGYDSQAGMGYLSDLWKFDPATNDWTWIAGSDLCNQSGSYGTLGTPSSTNFPGARTRPLAWKANNGNLALFGGMGYNNTTTVGSLNDLWMYNITTNQWTWVHGSNALDQSGSYGTTGTPSATNVPGGRKSAIGWKDKTGEFWMFGGFGKDAGSSGSGYLNDLWKYTEVNNEWTWVRGSNTAGAPGSYGSQTVTTGSNEPGARAEGITWVDPNNTLWMMGGEGFASTTVGKLNDLWRYDIATNMWTWTKSGAMINQTGVYGTINFPAFSNRPGGRNQSASWVDAKGNLYFFGGEGYGQNTLPSGPLNDLWKYTNCFISPITMTITAQDSVICAGESTSLTVTGSTNYLWMNDLTTASYLVIKPNVTTTYTVITRNDNDCLFSSSFTHTVSACAGLADTDQHNLLSLYPNPNNGSFTIERDDEIERQLEIVNSLGQIVYHNTLQKGKNQLTTGLTSGVYFYRITNDSQARSGKMVVN